MQVSNNYFENAITYFTRRIVSVFVITFVSFHVTDFDIPESMHFH